MSKHVSETPATAQLKALNIAYTEHLYDYIEHGGTSESAMQLGADEHAVVKTLVMQDEAAKPLIILMHGDCKVSTKNLARSINAKKIEPCKPDVAQRHTAYQVGGTSPFGMAHSSTKCNGLVTKEAKVQLAYNLFEYQSKLPYALHTP